MISDPISRPVRRVAGLITLAILPMGLLQGCASLLFPTLSSAPVDRLPEIDGVIEKLWDQAKPLQLEAPYFAGDDAPLQIEVRSVHTDQEIAFYFRWKDETRSDSYREYVREGSAGSPPVEGEPDDQFALKFHISGSKLSCMLAGKPMIHDVWHWQAGRGDLTGYAQDRQFIVRTVDERARPSAKRYRALNGSLIEFIWKEDSGDPLIVYQRSDTGRRNPQPLFTLEPPSGSQADIRAKGQWSDGVWVLELKRRLDTGHADDVTISWNEKARLSLAVFDRSEGADHFNTSSIQLKLD